MAITKYLPITIQPGINRNLTEYGEEGFWYSMDHVRFRNGQPQSIGGWQEIVSNNDFKGIARQQLSWTTLDGSKLLAYGTHNHIYIWANGSFNDITPILVSSSTSSCFGMISGSTTVSVCITNHNRQAGDFFIVDAATSILPGIDLSGEYEVLTVIDTNKFTINASVTAASTTVSAGGTVQYRMPIASGFQSNNQAFGWGRSTWGSGAWGTAVSSGVIRNLRTWSLKNWGEDMLASFNKGPLYYWDATNGVGTRATAVSTAPSVINILDVALSRQVLAFGTHDAITGVYDPLLIRWSSIEDYTDWLPTPLNSAGDTRLEAGSEIVAEIKTKFNHLVWSDVNVYSLTYVGPDDYFVLENLGANGQILGPNACVDVGGVIYWVGPNGFYMWNGQIQQMPCPIQKDLFDFDGEFRIDPSQYKKTFCGTNKTFNEIIWFFQSTSSTTNEIDYYVIYNYVDNNWAYGTLDRTTWLDVGIFSNVIATGANNKLYAHELGINAGNAPLNSFIESAPFDIADGDENIFIDQIVPDFQIQGSLAVYLKTKRYPGEDDSNEVVKGPYIIDDNVEYIPTRAKGRQAKVRIETSTLGSAWKLGKMRLRVKNSGRN